MSTRGLLDALLLVTVLGASSLAGCASPAEGDSGASQASASSRGEGTVDTVEAEERRTIARVIGGSSLYTPDKVFWSVLELKVPVDLVGNDRELVLVGNSAGATRFWRIDDRISGAKLTGGAPTAGKLDFVIQYDSRGPEGLTTDRVPTTVTYQIEDGVLAPEIIVSGALGKKTLQPLNDAAYDDLLGVALVHEPLQLEAEVEASVIQLIDDAYLNRISVVVAARTIEKSSAFFVGMVGDITSVTKKGNVVEIGATEESLVGPELIETTTRDITVRVEIDPALGTAKVTRR
jgi:hypothetical protein